MSWTRYHEINQAEVIRAISESQRINPEVARAAVDLCIEELRAKETMSAVFMQLLVFYSDQLRTHRGGDASRERLQRVQRAHELAVETMRLLWLGSSLIANDELSLLLADLGVQTPSRGPHAQLIDVTPSEAD